MNQTALPNIQPQTITAPQQKNTGGLLFGIGSFALLAVTWGWILGVGKNDPSQSAQKSSVSATPTAPPTPTVIPKSAVLPTPVAATVVAAVQQETPTPAIVAKAAIPTAVATPAQTAPSVVLKLATSITSVRFPGGGIELDSEGKAQLASFANDPLTKTAVKIHLRGFSGNSTISSTERRRLAFERAFSVKVALTNVHGIEPQKIRMFYFTNDHFGQPRTEFNSFQTLAEAELDTAKRLSVKK